MTQRAIVPRVIINLQDFRMRALHVFAPRIKNYVKFFAARPVYKNRAINFYRRIIFALQQTYSRTA